jgi:hypothetical protein
VSDYFRVDPILDLYKLFILPTLGCHVIYSFFFSFVVHASLESTNNVICFLTSVYPWLVNLICFPNAHDPRVAV